MSEFKIIPNTTISLWNGSDELYHIIKTGMTYEKEFMIINGGPHHNGDVEFADKETLFNRFKLEVDDVKHEGEKDDLCDFFLWFRANGEQHIGLSIEKMVELYLSEKSSIAIKNVQESDTRNGASSNADSNKKLNTK